MPRTRSDAADLAAAWERNAGDFVVWARADMHDSYWRFNRDLFLELVPPPGRRTLDLGCGEGRLSRDLKRLGHTAVGVDRSPTMLAAARSADPTIELHEADAAALPFEEASFDLVIAFMSLQDIEDLAGAVAEAGRVLGPRGHFCFAIVHPLNSAGWFEGEDGDARFVVEGSYLDESYYADDIERDGRRLEIVSKHRPLEAYVSALAAAGLVVEALREPKMPEHAIRAERSHRWRRLPLFLYARATKLP
jgi:SAM-dependent methyltransferase